MIAALIFLLSTSFQESSQEEKKMSMKRAVQGIGEHVNMLPRERGFSLPCVKFDGSEISVYRFFYVTRATKDKGMMVSVPNYVAEYDWNKKKFVALTRLDKPLKGLPDPPFSHNRPKFKDANEIIPEFEKIWELYDVLIEAYLIKDENSKTTIEAAKEYLHYFERHAEKPFMVYYKEYGGDFLKWVQDTGKKKPR